MIDIDDRFWAKVNKNGPVVSKRLGRCWIWTAAIHRDGYGLFGIVGTMRWAHRVSWSLSIGDIPNGLCILHKCDNRQCVRPSHLFTDTQADNIADCHKKGRLRIPNSKGEANGRAVLTSSGPQRIFSLKRSGLTQRQIANEVGISKSQVGRVLRKEQWKNA